MTPDFSGASTTVTADGDLWDLVEISGIGDICQRSYAFGGSYDWENGGYFYVYNTADDAEGRLSDCEMAGMRKPVPVPGMDWQGGVMPMDGIYGHARFELPWGWGVYGWMYGFARSMPMMIDDPINDWGPFYLKHYQPYAYAGRPAEVIASIMLHVGATRYAMDETNLNSAYTGQAADYGSTTIGVLCVREVGKTIASTIKEVARHSHDMIGFTMGGQFAMWRRFGAATCPNSELLGIQYPVRWWETKDHLFNAAEFNFGMATYRNPRNPNCEPTEISSEEEVGNSDYDFRAEWDPTLSHKAGDGWSVTKTDSTSQGKYGRQPITEKGKPLHMRLFWDIDQVQALADYTFPYFNDPRKVVEIKQDFRGLHYDLGMVVEDVAVTADGQTIDDMVCIAKEIDFNKLTVTSTLLEEELPAE